MTDPYESVPSTAKKAVLIHSDRRLRAEALRCALEALPGFSVLGLASCPADLLAQARVKPAVAAVVEQRKSEEAERLIAELKETGIERIVVVGGRRRNVHFVVGSSVIELPDGSSLEQYVAALDPLVAAGPRLPMLSSGGGDPWSLTAHEARVLGLVGSGSTTTEVASWLDVSVKAVENAKESVFRKLDVHSLAEATAKAFRGEAPAAAAADGEPEGRRRYSRPVFQTFRWQAELPKIVVAHEERLLAPALRAALGGTVEVLAQTVYGAAAIMMAEVLAPDIVVVSEMLADGVLSQFLSGLLRSGARVLVIGDAQDPLRVLRHLDAGAAGVVDGEAGLDEICGAVRAVAHGRPVVPDSALPALVGEWRMRRRGRGPHPVDASLTAREIEVLNAMTNALSTKAIARLLGVATKTVENHKTRIFHKLGVRSQVEAVSSVLAGQGAPGG
jgi:DNA-binding NarL/FixJ family response regulator